MSDWTYLNKCRESKGRFATTSEDGCNGLFWIWISSVQLRVIASDGLGWKHVSVSRVSDNRPPTWGLMCAVKELFWDDEDWVIQFHPAKSQYVNNHPGCLHLWQPTQADFPKPDAFMVGLKGATRQEIEQAAERY